MAFLGGFIGALVGVIGSVVTVIVLVGASKKVVDMEQKHDKDNKE